jgi:hypothetical protein
MGFTGRHLRDGGLHKGEGRSRHGLDGFKLESRCRRENAKDRLSYADYEDVCHNWNL